MLTEAQVPTEEGVYDLGYGAIHIITGMAPDKLTLKIVQVLNDAIVAKETLYYKNFDPSKKINLIA